MEFWAETGEKYLLSDSTAAIAFVPLCPYFIRRKTWTQTMGHKANVDPPWRKNARVVAIQRVAGSAAAS